jgi:DNA-directed RNA polymerase specialized sigma24 family protein
MGASSKYDKQAGDRRYESAYPALNSAAGLRILLADYHALKIRQYQGDYDATVILADLATAIEAAKLTVRQRQALRLVYEEDLTQEDAGRAMGLARESVKAYVEDALEKIAEIYFYWSGHGEGYGGADE